MVDLHPNLITYYDKHEDKDFIYLAIEKCEGNLENLIELMKEIKESPPGNNDWQNKVLGVLYKKDPFLLNSPEFISSLMHQAL
jgi:serine/threonine protein kinase